MYSSIIRFQKELFILSFSSLLLGGCGQHLADSLIQSTLEANRTEKSGLGIYGTYGGTFNEPPGTLVVATTYGPNREGKISLFHTLVLFSPESLIIGRGVRMDGGSSVETFTFAPKGYKPEPGQPRTRGFRDAGTARYLDVSLDVRANPRRFAFQKSGFYLDEGNLFLLKFDDDLQLSLSCQLPIKVTNTPTVKKLLPFYKELFPDDDEIQLLEYANEHLSGPDLPLEEKLKTQANPTYLSSSLNCSPQYFEDW